jgi:hypothetical protein
MNSDDWLKSQSSHGLSVLFLMYLHSLQAGGRRRNPKSSAIIKSRRKTKNKIFAMPAVAAAIPVKPKIAATRDITKNTIAQYNMVTSPFLFW